MSSPQQIKTTLTDLLKINHPVLLAGMNVAAGPKLAAAVTNAGGLGVIGGVRWIYFSRGIGLTSAGRLYPRHASRTGRRTQGLPKR
jgi:Nitronate monooxygenase